MNLLDKNLHLHSAPTQKEQRQSIIEQQQINFDKSKFGVLYNTISGFIPAGYQVGKDVGRSIARNIASAGISLTKFGLGKDHAGYHEIDKMGADDMKTHFGAALWETVFGDEPIKSVETRIAEAEISLKKNPTIQKMGLSEHTLPLAFGGVIASTAIDLTPLLGQKAAIKTMIGTETVPAARFFLVRNGVPADVADAYAPMIVAAKDETAVRAAVDLVQNSLGMKAAGNLNSTVKGVPVEDPVESLINAVKVAGKDRRVIEQQYSAERARRVAQLADPEKKFRGMEGYYEKLRILKGSLRDETPSMEALKLNNKQVNQLVDTIEMFPHFTPFEKVRAVTGLRKVLKGETPVQSDLAKLEEVFGSDFARAVIEKEGIKWGAIVDDIWNAPKLLTASLDASAFTIQGLIMGASQPKIWFGALKKLKKFTFSKREVDNYYDSLVHHPLWGQMKEGGLSITDPRKVTGGVLGREEMLTSQLPKKIPYLGAVYRAGERSFTPIVNKMRVDYFTKFHNQMVDYYGRALTKKELKEVANVVNNATGRASLRDYENLAKWLNRVFFAPRLHLSQFHVFTSPVRYAMQPDRIRFEQVKNLIKTAGVMVTGLSLLSLHDEVEVNFDPRSTDFGRVKIGNTRLTVGGRLTQFLRIPAQLATGEIKTSTGGTVYLDGKAFPYTTRGDRILRELRGKASPSAGLVVDFLTGSKFLGDPLSPGNIAKDLTVPLFARDIHKVYQEHPLGTALFFNAGALMGISTSVYDEPNPESVLRNKYIQSQKEGDRQNIEDLREKYTR